MVGYASALGGEVSDFPSQVADLTMEAVDQFRVAATGDQAAIVTHQGEPAVINSHGQAVPVASSGGILASVSGVPTWKLAVGAVALWYAWKKFF